ncbi:pyridoxamine 5'-phosphate oxidase [Luteipulveratus sp. YIM 133132]|uniref:Pyridoxamine 5'-phosphate oxidase n=1 Tax=Luteipulveratus flavus TaxID=3031728 RepID=A0ABT6C8L6_9MICO|nr:MULTISPECIES: pyridoxamine 5'-phosphate oxidase [unclassified Luteipulveratus]MDE9364202.1 pyridoxamine 5'-phosphate oxidase [Luteipulveratus sp. YIM 133132]MDF8263636.1 pyridoxamine 5'-phosphate oxidase [Luteipulveratus sp. YIM 133296]
MADLSPRIDYDGDGIDADALPAAPWSAITGWLADAREREAEHGDVSEPEALSVATIDETGQPHVRTVLMRYLDVDGPGFYTNLESRKGRDLHANPAVAASLTWPAMYRAIRFVGHAEALPPDVVLAYFSSRPWGSRISAWTSLQSQPVESRAELEAAYETYATRWPDRGRLDDVPVPPFWGGYRIVCDEVELWGGRRNRLHDRLVYVRTAPGALDADAAWRIERRQP